LRGKKIAKERFIHCEFLLPDLLVSLLADCECVADLCIFQRVFASLKEGGRVRTGVSEGVRGEMCKNCAEDGPLMLNACYCTFLEKQPVFLF